MFQTNGFFGKLKSKTESEKIAPAVKQLSEIHKTISLTRNFKLS